MLNSTGQTHTNKAVAHRREVSGRYKVDIVQSNDQLTGMIKLQQHKETLTNQTNKRPSPYQGVAVKLKNQIHLKFV